MEEHLAHISKVLGRLARAGVQLKRNKCAFLLPFAEYMGHVISQDELDTADSKVQAIVEAPSHRM